MNAKLVELKQIFFQMRESKFTAIAKDVAVNAFFSP